MHVSPAKHSYVWLPRKCDYWIDRQMPEKVILMCCYASQATQKVKLTDRQTTDKVTPMWRFVSATKMVFVTQIQHTIWDWEWCLTPTVCIVGTVLQEELGYVMWQDIPIGRLTRHKDIVDQQGEYQLTKLSLKQESDFTFQITLILALFLRWTYHHNNVAIFF